MMSYCLHKGGTRKVVFVFSLFDLGDNLSLKHKIYPGIEWNTNEDIQCKRILRAIRAKNI